MDISWLSTVEWCQKLNPLEMKCIIQLKDNPLDIFKFFNFLMNLFCEHDVYHLLSKVQYFLLHFYFSQTKQDSLTEANEQSRKVRRKRSTKRKNQTETPKVESRTDDSEIFEIDDVSSDEELANLARIPPGLSKSISLPVVEENKFERTREWATTSYDGFSHVFSDTEMSPISRLVGQMHNVI